MGRNRKRSKHTRRRENGTSTDTSASSSDGSLRSYGHKNHKHKKKRHRNSSNTLVNDKKSSRSRSRTHTSSRDGQSSNSLAKTQNLAAKLSAITSDNREHAITVISGGRAASSTPTPSGSRDVVRAGTTETYRKSSKAYDRYKKSRSSHRSTHISTDNRQSSTSSIRIPELDMAKSAVLVKGGVGAVNIVASRSSTTGPNTEHVIHVASGGGAANTTPKPSGSSNVIAAQSSKRHRKSSITRIKYKKSSRFHNTIQTSTCNRQTSNSSVRTLNIDKDAVVHMRGVRSSATGQDGREQMISLISGGDAASSTSIPSTSCDVMAGTSGDHETLTSVLTVGDQHTPTQIVPKLQVSGQQQSAEVKKATMESPNVTGVTGRPSSKEINMAGDEVWKSELQCSICSELFINATMLNCSHTFCEYCIKMWKRNKEQCPLCRTPITSERGIKILDTLVERISQTSEEKKQAREEVLRERKQLETNQNRLNPPATGSTGHLTGTSSNYIEIGPVFSDQLLNHYDYYISDNSYADSNNDDGDNIEDVEDDFAYYNGSGDHNDDDSDHYYDEIDDDENEDIENSVDDDNDDANENTLVNESDDVNDDGDYDDASGDDDVNSVDDNNEVSDDGDEASEDSNEVNDNSNEESEDSNEVSDDSDEVSDGDVDNRDYDDGNDVRSVTDNNDDDDGEVAYANSDNDYNDDVDNRDYDDENDVRSVTDNNDDDDGGVAYANSDNDYNDYNSNNESDHDNDHIDENDCDYGDGSSSHDDNDDNYYY